MRKKIYRKVIFFSFLSILFSFISCVSLPGEHQGALKNARQGEYEKSLKILEQKKQSVYGNKSEVLYFLDSGLLNHYEKNYETSIVNLSSAEKKIYDLYTKSVTSEIGSFLLNDTVLDYPGEDYEDIYLNVFNSLNYYHLGKIDDAIVETNRAMNKSKTLTAKYDQQIIKARNALEANVNSASREVSTSKNSSKASSSTMVKPSSKTNASSSNSTDSSKNAGEISVSFHDSALVEYLSILYRRTIKDYDGAESSYRMLCDDFKTQADIYNFPIPSTIDSELSLPKNQARLNVISFSSLSPVKDEIVIKDYYGLANYSFSLALPVLLKTPYSISKIIVTAKNIKTGKVSFSELELLESLENVAEETFELHRDLIYAKAVARAVTKSLASSLGLAVGNELSHSKDSSMQVAGDLIQIFTMFGNITRQAIDHADMRISRYFPARASVTGMNLDEGIYDIQVDYYEKNNKLLKSDFYENYNVKIGELNLIESVYLGGNEK